MIIFTISFMSRFISCAVYLLKANVVVEQIYGTFNLLANNLPQKHKESEMMQSGLNAVSSVQTFSSNAMVVSATISINAAKSFPALRSNSFCDIGGKKESQGTK